MTLMFVTMEIMPDSLEVNLNDVEQKVKQKVEEHGARFHEERTEQKPIAFGLKALLITFSVDESKGTDEFEEAFLELEEISSVKTVTMSRAMG